MDIYMSMYKPVSCCIDFSNDGFPLSLTYDISNEPIISMTEISLKQRSILKSIYDMAQTNR